jgi:hypothetical protein
VALRGAISVDVQNKCSLLASADDKRIELGMQAREKPEVNTSLAGVTR